MDIRIILFALAAVVLTAVLLLTNNKK